MKEFECQKTQMHQCQLKHKQHSKKEQNCALVDGLLFLLFLSESESETCIILQHLYILHI